MSKIGKRMMHMIDEFDKLVEDTNYCTNYIESRKQRKILTNKDLEIQLKQILGLLEKFPFYVERKEERFDNICYQMGAIEQPLEELKRIIKDILGVDK